MPAAYLDYRSVRMVGYTGREKLTGLMALHPSTHPGGHRAEGAAGGRVMMSVPDTYRPSKRPEVLELDGGHGLILYNHDSSLVHHLNPSAALVWRRCDGNASVRDLAGYIAGKHGLRVSEVLQQVSEVIAEFEALDLVENSDPAVLGPAGPDGSGVP